MDGPVGGCQASEEAQEVSLVAVPEVLDPETEPAPGFGPGDLEGGYRGRQLRGG